MSQPKPAKPFIPTNWYWAVAGSTSQVYSSAVGDYVPLSNGAYQTWIAAGNASTAIENEQSLGRVLGGYSDLIIRPIPPGILDGFQNQLSDVAEEVFRVLMAPAKLNWENRIRALERAAGISTAPDLTGPQLKQLLKSMA